MPQPLGTQANSQMKGFVPNQSYNPQSPGPAPNNFTMPASHEVQQGWDRLTAPIGQGGGLLDRAAGAFQAGVNTLGLPQQWITEAVTGGKFHDPATALGIENPMGQFVTNLALDPFNLLLSPGEAGRALMRGFGETNIAQRIKPFEEMVLDARGHKINQPLMFYNFDQASSLLQDAKVYLPINQHPELKTFTYDFTHAADATAERRKLYAALEDRNAVLYDVNTDMKKVYKPNTVDHNAPWENVDDAWKRQLTKPWSLDAKGDFQERGFLMKYLGTPSRWSNVVKGQVKGYEEARGIFSRHRQEFSDFVQDSTSGILDFHEGAKSAQNRAFMYKLVGDHKKLKQDVAAQAAYEANSLSIETVANEIRNKIYDELQGIPFERLDRKGGISTYVEGLNEERRAANKIRKEKGQELLGLFEGKGIEALKKTGTIPSKLYDWLVGVSLDEHAANPVTHLNQLQRRIGKERFLKPVEKAMKDMRREAVEKGLMGPKEREYSEMLSRAFVGKAEKNSIDQAFVSGILNNKDAIRSHKWQNAVTRAISEEAITLAETGGSVTSRVVGKARDTTYRGLMGWALDSAVRNVVGGTFNTLAEFGLKSLENVVPALKMAGEATKDARWAEKHQLQNVLSTSNGMMEEFFRNTRMQPARKNPLSTLWDYAMHPMQFTENFNRGLAYMSALKHNLSIGGMTVNEAIKMAEETTKKLHFGYSNIDVSPYLNNPVAKVFTQFMIYPTRQVELLMGWAKNPDERGKLLKYLTMTGAALNVGTRHGLDMSNVLGVGLGFSEYPPYLRFSGDGVLPHLTGTPPILKMAQSAFKNVRNLIDFGSTGLWGDPLMNQEYSHDQALSDFGDLVRLAIPGGRYGAKLTKHLIEGFGEEGKDPTQAWSVLAPVVGARYDPSKLNADRMLSLLGFAPLSEQQKRDELGFINNFVKFYRDSVSQLNQKILAGQDYSKLQADIQRRVVAQYGAPFERNGISMDTLRNMIRPSEGAYLKRARKNMTMGDIERSLLALPKPIRDAYDLED